MVVALRAGHADGVEGEFIAQDVYLERSAHAQMVADPQRGSPSSPCTAQRLYTAPDVDRSPLQGQESPGGRRGLSTPAACSVASSRRAQAALEVRASAACSIRPATASGFDT